MSGRPYAEVIGDPIAHSKSPLIHNFWLAKLGIDAEYRACHVRPDELEDYFTRRRGDVAWQGSNITIPHKISAIEYVDNGADARASPGAINAVSHIAGTVIGHNTDAGGFLQPLADVELHARQVAVVGTGGAARAILSALDHAGTHAPDVIGRDLAKARALLAEFDFFHGEALSLDDPVPPVSLLVNASALGMEGFPAYAPDLSALPDHAIVYDIVYAPLETPLLAAARLRGLATIDGLDMLMGQAALAFTLFFGQPAPREHDAELRALLTAP